MTKPVAIGAVCALVLIVILAGLNPWRASPQIVRSTVTDDAFGIIAARNFAEQARNDSIVLIAYGDEDDATEAAIRRRNAFLKEAQSQKLRIIAVVSPLAAYKEKMSKDALLTLPVREQGIDASSIRLALTHRPQVIVSLEGVPIDLVQNNLGRTRFFAADPYMINDTAPLVNQGLVQALLCYREDADWSKSLKDPEEIASARFRYLTR